MKHLNTAMLLITVTTSIGTTWAAGGHAGSHHTHQEGHWSSPYKEANRKNPVKTDANSIQTGKNLYQQHCTSCHGVNADGQGPAAQSLSPPPTDLTAMAGQHPDGDFAWKIKHGRGPMPSWDKTFSDTEIWHLVNFIQSLENNAASMRGHANHNHGHSN